MIPSMCTQQRTPDLRSEKYRRSAPAHTSPRCSAGRKPISLGVFSGHLEEAFHEATKLVDEIARVAISEPVDIVVTDSAGFPLDATFYQAVKAMVAALPAVKPGGTIIMAAALTEGIGSPEYTDLMLRTTDLDDFMRRITEHDEFTVDQWELEEQVKQLEALRREVAETGPAIAGAFDKLTQMMDKGYRIIVERILYQRQQDERRLMQAAGLIATGLFPIARPQERVLNPIVPFAINYGLDWPLRLLDWIDIDPKKPMQIIEMADLVP